MEPQILAKCVDSHTHLLDYSSEQLQAVLKEAYQNGVSNIVCNSTCSQQYEKMKKLVNNHGSKILGSFGVHPWYVNKQNKIQNWMEILESTLKERQQFLVGQIGLDFRKEILQQNPKQIQQRFFKSQLELSLKINRPSSVHCVRAHGQILKILKKYDKQISLPLNPSYNLIMHSYGGSSEITKSLLKLKNIIIYFSLSLNRKQDLCQVIPINRLLVETDSPYQNNIQFLNSFGIQGNPNFNQIKNLIPNMQSLSKQYKLDFSTFASIVYQNSIKAFRIKF